MWKKRFIPSYEDNTSDPLNLESRSKKPHDELQLQQRMQQEFVGRSPLPAHQCSNWNHSLVNPSLTMDPPLMNNPVNLMFQQQIEMDLRRRQLAHYEYVQPNNSILLSPDMFGTIPRTMVYGQPIPYYHGLQSGQYEQYLEQARAMQEADMVVDKVTRAAKSGNKDQTDNLKGRNTSFKAIIKNGELVQSEEGYLKVTNSLVAKSRNVYSDSSQYSDHINTNIHGVPLNLSMRDQVSLGQNGTSVDSFNPFSALSNNSSNDVVAKRPTKQEAVPPPTELDVQVKKPLPKVPSAEDATSKSKSEVSNKSFEAWVSVEPTPMSPSNLQNDLKILFPYLKMTNTGSLVLWNFLWALLKDENYKRIISWVSVSELKFSIVSSTSLASLWGKVKENPSMDWVKIKKILQLYVRKNLLKPGSCEYEFMFLVTPPADKENASGKK